MEKKALKRSPTNRNPLFPVTFCQTSERSLPKPELGVRLRQKAPRQRAAGDVEEEYSTNGHTGRARVVYLEADSKAVRFKV